MNRTEVERIAKAINGLRPDWPWNALVTFIETHLSDRAYRDAAVALAYVACEAETRTPKRVLESGPWWKVGPAANSSTEPGIVTYCEHGEPGSRCDACYPNTARGLGGSGIRPTHEQRAAMHAAITEAKTSAEGILLELVGGATR